jgi:DNA-binding MarR family transcriptional regulator
VKSEQNEALALALAVRNFALTLERYRTDIARQFAVGPTEIVALGHLFIEGSVTVSELAGELGITSASATEMVDRLENIGFAQRQPHPNDRRKRLVGLTPEGEHAATVFYSDLASQLRAAYTTLTPSQRDGVNEFLNRVAADLAGPSDPIAALACVDAAKPPEVVDGVLHDDEGPESDSGPLMDATNVIDQKNSVTP